MTAQNIVNMANALNSFVNTIVDAGIAFDDLRELGPLCGGLDSIKNWVGPEPDRLSIDTVNDSTEPIIVCESPDISVEQESEGRRIGEIKYSDELIHQISKYIRDTYTDIGELNFSKMTRDTIDALNLSMPISYLRAVLNGNIRTDITGKYFIKKGRTLMSVNEQEDVK